MRQGNWRTALKLRVVAQTIAAIVSTIAAIHQLLKKQLTFKGVLFAQHCLVRFYYGAK